MEKIELQRLKEALTYISVENQKLKKAQKKVNKQEAIQIDSDLTILKSKMITTFNLIKPFPHISANDDTDLFIMTVNNIFLDLN